MASNLRANPESLDYQSTVRTSQGEEGGGVGGTQTRKSEKKEKRSRQLLFRWAFFTVLASRTGGQFPGEKRTPSHCRQGRLGGADVSEDVSGLSAQLVAASAKNTSAVWCQRTKANTQGSAARSRYPPSRPCKLPTPLPGFGDLGEVLSAPQKEG